MASEREILTNEILPLLRRNNSVTLTSISGTGKTEYIREILRMVSKTHEIIEVHADELIEVNATDYLKIMLFKIHRILIKNPKLNILSETVREALHSNDPFIVMNNIKESLRIIMHQGQADGIIIVFKDLSKITSLDTTFFDSLKSLSRIADESVGFFFVDNTSLIHKATRDAVGTLYESLNLVKFNLPFANAEEFQSIVRDAEIRFSVTASEREKDKIFELTQGHLGLTKYSIFYLRDHSYADITPKKLIQFPPINLRLERIYTELSDAERNSLIVFLRDGKISKSIKTGLLDKNIFKSHSKNKDIVQFSIPLFEEYVRELRSKHSKSSADIEIKDGLVYLKGQAIDEELSVQELNILTFLIDRYSKVVSRDEVAEVIWGEEKSEEYSDWAIDQAVSRIRKKLGDNGYKPTYLHTVRGRGFMLSHKNSEPDR